MSTLAAQQQALVAALFASPTACAGQIGREFSKFIADKPFVSSERGLKAYQSNGRMLAERVLVAAYPVVTAIVSADSMGQLARALWHAHPPHVGDLAWWGGGLAHFMAHSPQLADVPWLPDVARLEWALHTAHAAADVAPDLASLALLTQPDAHTLTLRLAAATQVLALDWTVGRIVVAHQLALADDRSAHALSPEASGGDAAGQCHPALAALGDTWATHTPEHQVVWRHGYRPMCQRVSPEEAMFVQALVSGCNLGDALDTMQGRSFDFAAWLPQALQQGLVLGVRHGTT